MFLLLTQLILISKAINNVNNFDKIYKYPVSLSIIQIYLSYISVKTIFVLQQFKNLFTICIFNEKKLYSM